MQISIKVPDNLPRKIVLQKVKTMEEALRKEAARLRKRESMRQQAAIGDDPWTSPDIDILSIDTGREDGSINHDHYLYGKTKRI